MRKAARLITPFTILALIFAGLAFRDYFGDFRYHYEEARLIGAIALILLVLNFVINKILRPRLLALIIQGVLALAIIICLLYWWSYF